MPKLLNLNAPTIRHRTLIWLQDQSPTVNWSKWDAVVTSIRAYYKWKSQRIMGLIITEPTPFDLLSISKNVPVLFISQRLFDYDWSLFDNIINLLLFN